MKKTNNRLSRINDEILKETAGIIRGELKDPRLGTMVSVIRVETTSDLSYCKIFVSIYGDAEQKKEVMLGLKNSAGFVRKLIAERINLRVTPIVKFELDESLEYSDKINKLLVQIKKDTV